VIRRATGDLSTLSDAALDSRLQALAVDLTLADAAIAAPSAARKRSRKVFRGVVLTVAGILFATQSGGLTLLLSVIGVADLIDALEEDAAALRLQARLRSDLERLNVVYQRIAVEKANRDW
jgi:hypothetical protein